MKLQIRKSDLLAALICAANKDIRHYLNGVNVRYVPGGKDGGTLVLSGTDGHMLFCGTAPADWDGPVGEPFDIMIPGDIVKTACKGKNPDTVALERAADGHYVLGNMVFSPIDGRYPDVERIIPDKVSGALAQFNPELLERGQRALRAYFRSDKVWPVLHHNGESAAVMATDSQDAVVVVMPFRGAHEFKPFVMPRAEDKLAQAA